MTWERSRRRTSQVAIAVCLGMSGCKRFHPEDLSAARNAANFEARALDGHELKWFVEKYAGQDFSIWPPTAYDFEALSLAALFYHPELDVARAKWKGMEAGRKVAGERPNPTIGISPGYNTTTPVPSPWLVPVSLDIPIETAGKRGYRIDQAKELAEGARWNVAVVARAVRSRVRQRMVDLYIARETEVLLREQQSWQADNLRLVESQFEAGAISAFEMTQARIASDSAQFFASRSNVLFGPMALVIRVGECPGPLAQAGMGSDLWSFGW